MPARLDLYFPQFKQPPYEVSPHRTTMVGRAETCDLNLPKYLQSDETFGKVSRQHFKISYEHGRFVITDLSRNGTQLGKIFLSKDRPTPLCDGDQISLKISDDKILVMRVNIRGETPEETEPIAPAPPASLKGLIKRLREFSDVGLLGLPGAGKTTLLQKLTHPFEPEQMCSADWPDYRFWLFCYVNCMALEERSLAGFFRLLLAETRPAFETWPAEIRRSYNLLATPAGSLDGIKRAMLNMMGTVQRDLGKRIVFLLDQFDDVYPELPPELFVILKELKSAQAGKVAEPPLIYVMAMRQEFDPQEAYLHQFLRTGGSDYWLPPYDDEQLEDVLRPYQLDPTGTRLSFEWGGRQPRLTELIARYLRERPAGDGNEAALMRELLADIYIADHCREMWASLRPAEQAALSSVVKGVAAMPFGLQERLSHQKTLLVGEGQDLKLISPLFEAYLKSLLSENELPLENGAPAGLLIEEKSAEIFVDGRRLSSGNLTPLEEGLLRYLYQHAGKVCSVIDISEQVWKYNAEYAASKEAIARVISSLRQKLNEKSPGAGERYIQTVRGRGYGVGVK